MVYSIVGLINTLNFRHSNNYYGPVVVFDPDRNRLDLHGSGLIRKK